MLRLYRRFSPKTAHLQSILNVYWSGSKTKDSWLIAAAVQGFGTTKQKLAETTIPAFPQQEVFVDTADMPVVLPFIKRS